MTVKTDTWKILKTETLADGATVELRYSEVGKGRAKCRYWRMFRNGEQVGYASTAEDADANWQRVVAGMVRNDTTGRYEQTP